MTDKNTSHVAWATRVNQRWIVHQGLEARAKAYMEHLADIDPGRLERSCDLAYQLVRQAAGEDPKPWFYAGLFALATAAEAESFLASHWFTLSSIPFRGTEVTPLIEPDSVGDAAREKIDRIRQALSSLLVADQSEGQP